MPQEGTKTLTALANTEPVVGAQHPRAQGLQRFLSESTRDPNALTQRRVEVLCAHALTTPNERTHGLIPAPPGLRALPASVSVVDTRR